ncbi:MAG: hypothetical protein E7667_03645 [Ruminococcaceae bacterium]|nr:hypothetical protein [Oscillospiraceae bacterium]
MKDIFFIIAGSGMAVFFIALAFSCIRETISKSQDRKIDKNRQETEITELKSRNEKLESDLLFAQKQNIMLMAEKAKMSHPIIPNTTPITNQCCNHNVEAYTEAICDDRWDKATSGDIIVKNLLIQPKGTASEDLVPGKIDIVNIHAKIYSKQSDKIYTTSLTQCNCESFKHRNKDTKPYVCKHMLALAIETDALPFLKK